MTTCLVTGGAGYIGSNVCKALAEHGYSPVTYDNLSRGNKWAVKWGPLEIGDISDGESLRNVMIKYKPEAVLHFAAYAYVGESVKHPEIYYRNNVAGTLTLLDVMRSVNVLQLVFSSSCAVYGVPSKIPIPEDHRQKPVNPYGASKLMIERMLQDFDLAYGLKSITLRYFNAAGADINGEIGESHVPETHLIPRALDVALGKRRVLEIFGDDYNTTDGTCVRDYIHVTDLAMAHVLAFKHLINGKGTDLFNLGTGQGYSVKQVVDLINKVTGKPVPCNILSRREGDPPVLIADSTKSIAELDWTPRYSTLDRIISDAWNWHQKKFKKWKN